jgi:hypothetical protein
MMMQRLLFPLNFVSCFRAIPSVGGDTKLSSSCCDFDTIPELQVFVSAS